MKYGIAIFPSKALQDEANSYRKRYDSHYSLIPPHITLKNPFEIEGEKLQLITNYIRTVTTSISPFTIHIYKIDSFYPNTNKIFFKIRSNSSLEKLHQLLHQDILHEEQSQKYTPHVTIGQDLTNQEHFDVLGQLKMYTVNYEETIDRIQLLYQLENGSWSVHETFHLGKDC
ncbi:YjcG family protein [Alkalihalobacterium alkalinitrilicum]|uniref:YjcG family protein n=1 Tax=Alkalihalobacterium alkalinitrilicum TaxID=427920 RepID=UPI000995A6DD|nr:YjcG family protein [Alkalihalobacterium alkalinitrilicum]